MSDSMDTGVRYRLSWRHILISSTLLIFYLPVPFLLFIFIWLVQASLEDTALKGFGLFILLILSPIMFLLICGLIIPGLLIIGNLSLSYLKVSPNGLEYRNWPSFGMRCKWEDVESVAERREFGFFRHDVLYLKNPKYFGWQWNIFLRETFGLKLPRFIPISNFTGWPKGKLAADLSARLPGIIGKPPN